MFTKEDIAVKNKYTPLNTEKEIIIFPKFGEIFNCKAKKLRDDIWFVKTSEYDNWFQSKKMSVDTILKVLNDPLKSYSCYRDFIRSCFR